MERKYVRVVGLMLGAAIVGYLIGPPIAQAAAGLVMVKDSKTAAKARVTAGNLWVNDSGSFVYSKPWGETVLAAAPTGSGFLSGIGDITGVSIDVPSAGASAVSITLRKGTSQGAGTIIWQGTLPAAGHLDYSFDQEILLSAGFNWNVVNAGGASLQYEVYGAGFGVAFTTPANASKSSG
jgi:hypothetical protein